VLSFHPLLIGGNPFRAPAIYCLIPALEHRWGVHYPIGGVTQLVEGLASLIEGQGGTIECEADVAQILVRNGTACGVRLADGRVMQADVVVSNADAAFTYGKLLPNGEARRWRQPKLDRARYSMGLAVCYFGTSRQFEAVGHHTILLGPRYRGLLHDMFERKRLTDDFSLYVHRPSASDPSVAPEGCDAFYALCPVPNNQSGIDWSVEGPRRRNAIVARLEATILPGLSRSIISEAMMTPNDFASDYQSPFGAGFSLEPTLMQSAWFPADQCQRGYRPSLSRRRGHAPGRRPAGRALLGQNPRKACSRCSVFRPLTPMPRQPTARPAAGRSGRGRTPSIWLRRSCRSPCANRPTRSMPSVAWPTISSTGTAGGARRSRRSTRFSTASMRNGPSEHFIERSLADVVRRFAIPRAIPNALIEGLEWDAAGRRYQSLAELEAYAARVAGTVGIMMTLVMGRRDATTLARAADLGVAMQLTNIVRDIGEDARAGRLFLPLDLMKAAGVDPHRWLLQPEPEDGVRRIAKALLARADTLYERSRDGISQLPRDCQTGIEAARLLYRAIGQKVATGLDPVSQRAVTSRLEKLGCLGQASMVRFHRAGRHVEAPPLEATAFLIDAVRLHHVLPTERPLPPWWQVGARATRMLELLDAFAARETVRPAARQRGAGA
jgi:phytoene/squalene synthetase